MSVNSWRPWPPAAGRTGAGTSARRRRVLDAAARFGIHVCAMTTVLRGLVPGESRRASAQDHAYHFLRAAIVSGELRGGERLLQEAIAEQLKISRIPVRDAIGRLHAEGLVTVHPN